MGVGVQFVFKPLIPEEYLPEIVQSYMASFMEEEAGIIYRAFLRTVKAWTNPAHFTQEIAVSGGRMLFRVYTEDPIYIMLNNGPTKPGGWPIYPRRPGGRLRFPGGKYQAKTAPRVIGSHQGGRSGDPEYRNYVWHPGFAARRWAEEIWDRREQGAFYRKLQEAIARGLRGRARRSR